MSAPTAKVRLLMLERDGGRCAACFAQTSLEAQHRRAVGMGGSKVRPGLTDLLVLCAEHNARAEGDMQDVALRRGHKVRRWISDPGRVPVFYVGEGWYRLKGEGREGISPETAEEMMRAAYGAAWTKGGVL